MKDWITEYDWTGIKSTLICAYFRIAVSEEQEEETKAVNKINPRSCKAVKICGAIPLYRFLSLRIAGHLKLADSAGWFKTNVRLSLEASQLN